VTAAGDAAESIYEYRLYVGPTSTITSIPLQFVDFNSDARVDGQDFLIIQRGMGLTNASRSQGDADGNGIVNGLDLALWRTLAFQQLGLSAAQLDIVPEPSTLGLAIVVLMASQFTGGRSHRAFRQRRGGELSFGRPLEIGTGQTPRHIHPVMLAIGARRGLRIDAIAF
jgi:hypothetical protein